MLTEILRGFAITLKSAFSKPLTVQWPEEQKPVFPRHRGRHILHRYDNGMEKCIGCELCAAACPVGCIYVGPAENDPQNPVSPGERYAVRYEINLMRCIYCGYCAEACPTEAITLGPRYDLSDYRRERTVVTKAELLEAWPKFAQAKSAPNPAGAGNDQREMAGREPGVSPRLAWESAEAVEAMGSEFPHPGYGGVPEHVPEVAEPSSQGEEHGH